MDVKNPVLLKGQTLSPERTLRPYTLKLTVVENGVSNGSMVIGPDEPAINVGAWLRVWTCQGDMGVYRVTSINHDVTGQKRTINFEHLINALSDSIIFHEVKATDIDPNAETAGGATVTKTIEKALTYQRNEVWKLGKCEFSERQMFNFLQQTVWDAVQSVLNTLEGYVLRFKMDELPFTLRVEKEETAATCEMRLNRNLSTMQKSINRSDMFTRLYPVGAKDLHINDVNDGKAYIMQNHGLYGVIESTKQEPSITDAKELLAWGKAQLKKFSKPSVTITISGLELSGSTGLAIDKLVVGTMCNVPLPDFGTVETERITQLAWADVLAKPEAVTVTMANNRKTVQGIVQQVQQQQKKAKARDDKDDTDKEKEYHTWFEKTDESITAGASRITDAEAAVSELKITAGQIKSDVTKLDRRTGDIEKSTVIQNADKITDMVGNFSFDKNGNLIIANAGGLILKTDKTEIGLYKNGKLDAGMIVEALNDGTTTTKIKGSMVEISGTTILGLLKGKTITAKNIAADDTISGAYLSGKIVKAGDHNTVFIDADGTMQNIPSIHTEALFVHAAGVFPDLYADVTDAVLPGRRSQRHKASTSC